jgi:hypothetical protein
LSAVFGLLKIKPLIFGLLLASPALAAWAYLGGEPVQPQVSLTQVEPTLAKPLRIPVEVIAKGSAPKWVYVEVAPQAIPEPGFSSLLLLTGVVFIFRRTRKPGISGK